MKHIYVLDTNILVNWAICGTALEEKGHWAAWYQPCADFCNDTNRQIVIPGIVWAELHGLMLQKDIDIDDLDMWNRNKQMAMTPIWRAVQLADSHITILRTAFDPLLAEQFCRAPLSKSMKRQLKRDKERAAKRSHTARLKVLDGVDSAILAAAFCVAEQEPARMVHLVTMDRNLGLVNDAYVNSRKTYRPFEVPENLGYWYDPRQNERA